MADIRITPGSGSIQFSGSVSGDVVDLIYTGSTVQFNTGSVQLLGIKETGNVQVGSLDNPNSVLEVTGSIQVTGEITSSRLGFNDSVSYFGVSNDVRNWYLTGKSLYIVTEDSATNGIFFKPDGTRFYIVGTSNDRVRAYDMSTAWDITTGVIAESFSTSPETAPADVFFKPDGTVMYLVGIDTDLVRQFDLPTPWILTGATANGTFSVNSQDPSPQAIYLKPDGTKLYMAGSTNDRVFEYDLGTAWNVTTAVFLQSFSVVTQDSAPVGLSFNNSGSRMYILGQSGDDITEYRLSTPWDISTAEYFSESFTFIQEANPSGLYFNEDENKAFVVGTGGDTIYELGTDKQLKIYGDSVTTDSQLYVGGRFEVRQSVYSYGSITTLGTLTAGSTFTSLNAAFGSGTVVLGSSNIVTNIGATTTGSVHRFGYGATIAGSTKTIEIGTGGLTGSFTDITLHSIFSSGSIVVANNALFQKQVSIVGGLQVQNTEIPLLASQTASGIIPFLDTFTEASDTLLNAHTPDTGSGWTRVEIPTFTTPTFTVVGGTGVAGPTANVTNQGVIYVGTDTLTDANYEVTTTFSTQASADDTFWLIARYQDADNFYGVKWSTTQGNCGLYKKVAGIWTLLGSITSAPATGTATLTLRVYKNIISVINNGVVMTGIQDNSISSPGQVGVAAGNIGQLSTDDTVSAWRITDFKTQYYGIQAVNSYIENGNLGIGTTSPSTSLHISGASAILTLSPIDSLPTSGIPSASFATSGSGVDLKPYFWNGVTWTALF